ncbi:microsomal glutathione S-transferase 2 isoform X1 [Amblyraja radiata]|uniref:microsomal glutathione S-transferase 2 isoform X1 n=1 Tax=Amblyraja radiata TaxID=386614 RepID=UPI00140404FB|nr:microsomal glutathione S-transferase 2 isoform X1 [Amblyraja radiata]
MTPLCEVECGVPPSHTLCLGRYSCCSPAGSARGAAQVGSGAESRRPHLSLFHSDRNHGERLRLAGCCLAAVCRSAGQNSVEFFPVFLVVLWISGLFFNQEIASVVGLAYLFSRLMYFNGYAESTKRRLPGFRIGVAMLLILTSLSIGGITNSMCDNYFDFNLGKKIRKMFL